MSDPHRDPRTFSKEEIAAEERRFREMHCRAHGWPIDDYDWCLRREQLRNWQRLRLPGRDARLAAYAANEGDLGAVVFCPRCAAPIAVHTSKEAKERHEIAPLKNDCHSYWCGDCDEYYVVYSVPSPYGGSHGWDERRRLMIARWVGAALSQQKQKRGLLRRLFG
jgi:hypothetical protein